MKFLRNWKKLVGHNVQQLVRWSELSDVRPLFQALSRKLNWFLKPEQSKNCRKNGISWISRAVLYSFSWNFAQWCEMAIPKTWQSPILKKQFFPAVKMPEICRKTRFFALRIAGTADFRMGKTGFQYLEWYSIFQPSYFAPLSFVRLFVRFLRSFLLKCLYLFSFV